MKKRYIASAAGVIGAGVTGYFLFNRRNGHNNPDFSNGQFNETLTDAGIPDQVEVNDAAQLENAKMVSEGSQFGVHYYNEVTNENE
ncbi:hypothetical protein [Lentibacillus cibarius]|uniref:Uncharacterized protein n=1 Tax=Lentibacillus cibarius TaxID=2583219 RepID=A0A5S3R825_9BACI|nr:hypothetical protein [Lentibacillus cibarius]TMN23453.1 hypothetical protein FFL34_16140 [Lentibacillus cibarius]